MYATYTTITMNNGAFTAHFSRLSYSLQPEPMAKQYTVEELKKIRSMNIPDLIAKATKRFNKFIRERDKNLGCISCGGEVENAGHYYSAGKYPSLRFNEDNVHGQTIACNKWRHGNLIEYRKGLVKRIGEERVKKLDDIADAYKRNGFKWDKFALLEIIEKYKQWK